jgi:uncharacterized protein (DUF433 family)
MIQSNTLSHRRHSAATLRSAKIGGRMKSDMGVDRITRNPEVMGGKPCVRGMRVTVEAIVGLVASGRPNPEILAAYPYFEEEDLRQALAYADRRVGEIEVPLPAA